MALADVLAILGALAVLGVAVPSLLTLVSLCLPRAVADAAASAGSRPLRSLAGGLLVAVLAALAGGAGRALGGPGALLGAFVLLGALSVTAVGLAGIVRHIAGAYRHEAGKPLPFGELFASAAILEFAAAVPVVGWFVVLPAALLIALGSGASALAPRMAGRAAGEALS